ncbi:MAG: hypothetical protein ACRD3N_14160 [Terracidiphilus sp.]
MTKPSAEFTAFDNLVRQVLSVSREELKRREAEYKRQSEARLFRPGPKRGTKRKPKGMP